MYTQFKGRYGRHPDQEKKRPTMEAKMDDFFKKTKCDRCHQDFNGCRTMSMFNTQVICMTCKEKEQQRADYRKAVEADHAEIRKGNYNYQGIGLDD